MTDGTKNVERLLRVGIALSGEHDADILLRTILDEAISITACDGGTLYILEGETLRFKIMITRSLNLSRGAAGEVIDLPPVPLRPENVCARAALDKKLYNIADVYAATGFDFSGPRRYDAMTGYRTASMLVLPMEDDHGQVIGVLQLINAISEDGEIVPFDPSVEQIILSLASQAAITLTNLRYQSELMETMDSFVRVMSTAIDARSPYNANHTRNMVKYAERFLDWAESAGCWSMSAGERRQLLMSIWLHDVGKLVIPLEVMDKRDRLGAARPEVENRFKTLGLLLRIEQLSGRLSREDYDRQTQELASAAALVERANAAGFLDDETLAAVGELALRRYPDGEGGQLALLTQEELHALSVRKGTLTAEERTTIESHAEMTGRMLGEMHFTGDCAMVPQWAAAHHELLNGRGYPRHMQGEEIPREVRLLTILDIFDALTARDRPYKSAVPTEKALTTLDDMVNCGQLDGRLLAWFTESRAWEEEKK